MLINVLPLLFLVKNIFIIAQIVVRSLTASSIGVESQSIQRQRNQTAMICIAVYSISISIQQLQVDHILLMLYVLYIFFWFQFREKFFLCGPDWSQTNHPPVLASKCLGYAHALPYPVYYLFFQIIILKMTKICGCTLLDFYHHTLHRKPQMMQ